MALVPLLLGVAGCGSDRGDSSTTSDAADVSAVEQLPETVESTTTTTEPVPQGSTLTATSSEGDILKLTLSVGEPQRAASAAPAGVDLADACQVGIDRATIVKFHYVAQMASSLPADVHMSFSTNLESTKAPYLVVDYSDSGWSCRSDGAYPHSSFGLGWNDLSQSPRSGDFYFLIPDAISPNDPSGAFETVREIVQLNVGNNYSLSAESEGDPWLLCGTFDKSLDLRVSGSKGCQ